MAATIQALLLFVIVATFAGDVMTSKVLLMPYHHRSHVSIFKTQGKALQDFGHEVWMMTLTKFQGKLTKSGLKLLLYEVSPEADFNVRLEELMAQSPSGEGVGDEIMVELVPSFGRFCDEVQENKELMAAIKREKFDLVVFDGVVCVMCMYMIPYQFDIPFITVHGFQMTSWPAGVTGLPSIEPELETKYSNRMTFWERIENLKIWMMTMDNMYSKAHSESHMAKYAPPHKPKITLDEVQRQSEMFLLNFEIMCLDYPRMSAPNYQFIGASTASPAKPLPPDLENFVQGAEHGIVIMSLGSMKAWQWVWNILREKLFAAFGRLPQRVIVQYSLGDSPPTPPNVKLMEWLPQNDLLGHPKTRLFVTHGGNNGQNEAVYHGVPMLVIPITIDQPYAGVRVETHAYGRWIEDKNKVTENELYAMMSEIINNDTYSQNIKKCSAIIRSMPSSQERFLFWVNHILQFGGAHLRPPSIDMPLYQVLMLDIIAYYVLYYFALGLGAIVAVSCCICFLYNRSKKASKTKHD